MVVEAVVVGIDGTCPEAPGWVTITYQLSKTEHTTRDGKLEMARLEHEAALGVNLAYPGAFRARLRAALGGTVVEATPPGIDGVFENLSDGEYVLEVEKDPDASFTPHVNDAVARRMRDMGASDAPDEDDEDNFETALAARMAILAAGLAFTKSYVLDQANGTLEAAGSGALFTPVEGLATEGIYATTRNPMYCGLIFFALPTLSVVVNSGWPILIGPITWAYLNYIVIAAEEALLTQAFGAQYAAYCEKVPRWLI